MNILIFSCVIGFWTLGFVLMITGIRNVCEGCEDDGGFHVVRNPREPEPALHGVLHHRI